jgi:hypothetical protein
MIKNILDVINRVEENLNDFSEVEISELVLDKLLLSKFESDLEYNIKLIRINKRTQRDDIYEKSRQEGKTQEDCKLIARKSIRSIEKQELKLKSLLEKIKQTKRNLKLLIKEKNGNSKIS